MGRGQQNYQRAVVRLVPFDIFLGIRASTDDLPGGGGSKNANIFVRQDVKMCSFRQNAYR